MRQFSGFISVLVLLISLSYTHIAQAAGVVTNCDEYDAGPGSLADAVASGGLITFACSGTIAVPGIGITVDTTIDATGQNVILTGSNTNSIFYVTNPYFYYEEEYVSVTLTLINLTLTDGYSESSGGAITVDDAALDLYHVTIRDSSAELDGGAIRVNPEILSHVGGYGSVRMYDSALINNKAGRSGGAIYGNYAGFIIERSLLADNQALSGGGGVIYLDGAMYIEDSTFSDNKATKGGVIYVYSYLATSLVLITNSTFSYNHADNQGGAIYRDSTDTGFGIRHSTFYGNSALEGGAIYAVGTIDLFNSLIAASTGGDCGGDDVFLNTNSLATGLCGTTAPTGIDPVLSDNGGPTPTHALLAGSNAIDAAPRCPPIYTDQRGNGRPADGNNDGQLVCDIGAIEVGTTSGAPMRNVYRYHVNDFVLAWGPVEWATGYEIEISRNADFTDIVFTTINPADMLSVEMNFSQWVISRYHNGPYYWRVRAQRPDTTWGDWSEPDGFIIDGADFPWYFLND